MELTALVLALVGIAVAIALPLTIEYLKRPGLRVERATDADRIAPSAFRIVHVKIVNEPIGGVFGRWLMRNVATGCRVTISVQTENGVSALPAFNGKWSAKPEPIQYLPLGGGVQEAFDPAKWPGGLVYDLSPGLDGEPVAVAIKHDGEADAYAFHPMWIYQDPVGLRNAAARLSETEYEVTVTAEAGEITADKRFKLRNDGMRHTDLGLSELT